MTDLTTTGLMTPQRQADTTPSDVVAWLRAGNRRFAAGRPRQRDLLTEAAATADAQHPLAAVLGCIDSRVPVEAVLDLGIGHAFVARTAGHVVDDDVLGSLEFATHVAGARVVLVLGHTSCGAVVGACDGVELGHLTGLLDRITPAVLEASGGRPTPGSDDPELVQRAVEAHTRRTVDTILEASPVITDLVVLGQLAVIGAVYDLGTGRVTFLE